MMKKYIVTLTEQERQALTAMISRGKGAARKLMHARILLKTDEGGGRPRVADAVIAQEVQAGPATVERVRKAFVEEGLEAALGPRKSCRQYLRKLDGQGEARLVALACTRAPQGHSRWTLRLLADRLVQLEVVDHLSHETVRQVLKKTNLSPG
jgi:transposase